MDSNMTQILIAVVGALATSPLLIKYLDYLITKQSENDRFKKFEVKLMDSELISLLKKYGREVSNLKFEIKTRLTVHSRLR